MKNDKQDLVDICFEIALTIQRNPQMHKLSQEEMAEWVARQLRLCGFHTKPRGASWGVLVDPPNDKDGFGLTLQIDPTNEN